MKEILKPRRTRMNNLKIHLTSLHRAFQCKQTLIGKKKFK